MEPTFPLLRLPENAIVKVLKIMSLKQLLEFSYVSTKTKNLVKSLGIIAKRVDITIHGLNEIGLNTYHTDFGFQPSPLIPFSDNLKYIRTIFCCTLPPNVRFYADCERHEVRLLKETIGNVNFLYVSSILTDELSREVLKHFNTPSRLYLLRNPYEDTCKIQEIFIRNHKIIEFNDDYSLDDMLSVNSEKVRFIRSASQKQMNKFVKHWIRGSNPQLQIMSLSIKNTDFVNGETHLKGIRCMDMSEEAKREIRQEHGLPNCNMVQIRREDGTTAVIASNQRGRHPNIHLIVMH
ncbi:hypothetical protein GCK72_026084 [Caenorhabditis remanei]|uniref:F-box domain-containing protein n=1 Tax=Caenorhabditis remanei TaxID=31234 RepID=A0A6A5G3W6_CAERE|nr:hypothetical protein GCK72_026084 [Caenorhabditis remanei]KAF1749616.1 hypothetical protein GCK72_026084 [Caenorhabditis remanei]